MQARLERSSQILSVLAPVVALSLVLPVNAADSAPPTSSSGLSSEGIVASAESSGHGHETHFGASVWPDPGESTREAFRRAEGKYGRLGAVRVFFPSLPASWSRIDATYGRTRLVVSFKASPGLVLSGSLDRTLRQWFHEAPRHRVTRWSYWHEPEDDIESKAFSSRQYRRAWRHLHELADQAGNPHLRSTLILMCWTLRQSSHREWRSYYAGDKTIDLLSYDCYNEGHHDNRYTPPRRLLRPQMLLSRRLGKPWALAELGSVVVAGDTGRGRARWLRQVARYTRLHHARFVTYFDSDVGVDFRLHDSPSTRAWRGIVTSQWR